MSEAPPTNVVQGHLIKVKVSILLIKVAKYIIVIIEIEIVGQCLYMPTMQEYCID